jgi:hypothetical protein
MKVKFLWLFILLNSLLFASAQKVIIFNKQTIEVPEIVWAEHLYADNSGREEIYVAVDDINILTQTIIEYNSNNAIKAIFENTINLNMLNLNRTYIQPIDRSLYKTPSIYSVRIQPKEGYKVMQRYMFPGDTEWQKTKEDVGQLYANLNVIAQSLLKRIQQVKQLD